MVERAYNLTPVCLSVSIRFRDGLSNLRLSFSGTGATSTSVGPLPDSWLAAHMADLTPDLQVCLSWGLIAESFHSLQSHPCNLLYYLLYFLSLFSHFWRHKTHKGWPVVKCQHNQSIREEVYKHAKKYGKNSAAELWWLSWFILEDRCLSTCWFTLSFRKTCMDAYKHFTLKTEGYYFYTQ